MAPPALPEGRRSKMVARRLATKAAPPVVALAILAWGWQVLAAHNRYIVPPLGSVWSALSSHPRAYLDAALATLQETGVGLGSSFVIAFCLAVAMGHSRLIERAVMPLAVMINVTPIVALAPGLTIGLGYGESPRYVVTALIVFFPMLVNTLAGLRSADPELIRYFASLDASRRDVLVRLRIPSSLPFLFTAARICFPLSLIGAVVSEFTTSGSNNGLGSLIYNAYSQTELPAMYGGVFCLSALGLLFTLLVAVGQRRMLFWYATGAAGAK